MREADTHAFQALECPLRAIALPASLAKNPKFDQCRQLRATGLAPLLRIGAV